MDVDVTTEEKNAFLRVKVTDTGRGIAAERLQGLFDPPASAAAAFLAGGAGAAAGSSGLLSQARTAQRASSSCLRCPVNERRGITFDLTDFLPNLGAPNRLFGRRRTTWWVAVPTLRLRLWREGPG